MQTDRETLYVQMNEGVSDDDVLTAFHVCHRDKSDLIQQNGTAGGVANPNPNCGAPTEKQCVHQVSYEVMPGTNTPRVVIEFGVGSQPRYNGTADYIVCVFNIQAKYLRWGSGTEGGWCAYPTAPVVWLRTEKIRK